MKYGIQHSWQAIPVNYNQSQTAHSHAFAMTCKDLLIIIFSLWFLSSKEKKNTHLKTTWRCFKLEKIPRLQMRPGSEFWAFDITHTRPTENKNCAFITTIHESELITNRMHRAELVTVWLYSCKMYLWTNFSLWFH